MIGQNNNKQMIEKWEVDNSFPPFIIITGAKGSGRTTLSKYIANKLKGYAVFPGNKVDEVRQAVDNSYRCGSTTVYIFTDTDRMSVQAKNALLKVTEEPPRRAYFILTAEDRGTVLPTLLSRGTELKTENYTTEELRMFTTDELILSIATTPGEIEKLIGTDVKGFISFAEKVLDNIGKVSGVNALKIGQSFKYKETDTEGYDLILFLNTLQTIALDRLKTNKGNIIENAATIKICAKYKRELTINGVKKDSTFDMFILELRDAWRD